MPRPTKIVNHQEAVTWFEEGHTYQWMIDEYRRKYGVETGLSFWGSFRARYGLPRRIERDHDLIPWHIKEQHRWGYPVAMLRAEVRRRKGTALDEQTARKLKGFLERLERDNLVVEYCPDTEDGWSLVPRREGIDRDLIHEPERKTTVRRRQDG